MVRLVFKYNKNLVEVNKYISGKPKILYQTLASKKFLTNVTPSEKIDNLQKKLKNNLLEPASRMGLELISNTKAKHWKCPNVELELGEND